MTEHTDVMAETSSTDHGVISTRSPIGAVLLTLLVTGLGHVYCGQLVIGLTWAAVGALSGVVSLWTLATQDAGILAASLPIWFVSVAAAVHAWCAAKNCPSDYRLKSYNRWYVYVLLFAISSVGVAGHGLIVRSNLTEAFVTPVNDMQPTLHAGDRFFVDKTAYRHATVAVGDVVAFRSPAEPRRVYVKRVLALAGDTIEIRNGQLLVNDQAVGEADPSVEDFGPEVVPRYNCFVLGDNRRRSKDSRHFGPIPHVGILGKATVIFWPQESWSRFGRID